MRWVFIAAIVTVIGAVYVLNPGMVRCDGTQDSFAIGHALKLAGC